MKESYKIRRMDGKSMLKMEQMVKDIIERMIVISTTAGCFGGFFKALAEQQHSKYKYDGKEWIPDVEQLINGSSDVKTVGLFSTFNNHYKYKTNKSINKRKKNSLYKNKGSYYGR
ncbi:MAG: hypothetical protein GY870_22080 [archaeon]|nr:hypothetical protein [archaeon]